MLRIWFPLVTLNILTVLSVLDVAIWAPDGKINATPVTGLLCPLISKTGFS